MRTKIAVMLYWLLVAIVAGFLLRSNLQAAQQSAKVPVVAPRKVSQKTAPAEVHRHRTLIQKVMRAYRMTTLPTKEEMDQVRENQALILVRIGRCMDMKELSDQKDCMTNVEEEFPGVKKIMAQMAIARSLGSMTIACGHLNGYRVVPSEGSTCNYERATKTRIVKIRGKRVAIAIIPLKNKSGQYRYFALSHADGEKSCYLVSHANRKRVFSLECKYFFEGERATTIALVKISSFQDVYDGIAFLKEKTPNYGQRSRWLGRTLGAFSHSQSMFPYRPERGLDWGDSNEPMGPNPDNFVDDSTMDPSVFQLSTGPGNQNPVPTQTSSPFGN